MNSFLIALGILYILIAVPVGVLTVYLFKDAFNKKDQGEYSGCALALAWLFASPVILVIAILWLPILIVLLYKRYKRNKKMEELFKNG